METTPTTPETADQRLARQAACFRRLADLGMIAAESAAKRIQTADDTNIDPSKPTNDLVRVTRAVIIAVQAENVLFAPAPAARTPAARTPAPEPPRAPANDPRRAPLREALHEAATDPDPARRRKIRAAADAAVEQALLDDPDKQTSLYTHLKRIAAALDIPINPSNLSDEVLGMPPRVYVRDG